MASVKAVLPFVAERKLEDAMAVLNDKLVQELAPREFVALTLARYYPATHQLQLANAGCPDPYRISTNGVEMLQVPGIRLPLGIRRGTRYETLATTVAPGDRVLFVSDGIPEAPTDDGEPLGYEGLASMLRTALQSSAANDAWLDQLLTTVRRAVADPISDDWTAVLLQT
jgi:serine phosphatase RsbU (regulator of sigma subunit)